MPSTKTKTAAKPKRKLSTNPKDQPKRGTKTQKSSAKPKTKRAATTKKTGKTKTVKVAAIRNPRWDKVAKLATTLVTSDGNGGTVKRGPVSTPQVEKVATMIGRKKASAVLSGYGFKSVKQAENYAGGKLSRKDLPDGTGSAMSEASQSIGTPTKHKINGRKLAAILVALAK